jgi:flagellin-like hook-associated protein FlgL
MRITTRAVTINSLAGLNRNLSAVAKLQEQLTSGKTIQRPSDSPTGTNKAMQARNDVRANEQYARNISDGKGWVAQTDSVLQTMSTMSQKVRELTLQGMSDGNMSPSARQAIAAELKGLHESFLGLANQQSQGRPIFGGVTGSPTAYDSNGNWTGNDSAPVQRRVSSNETVRIDISGVEAFGPPGDDLFAIVNRIATDVTADPDALGTHLGNLDVAMDRMLSALTDIGARANRMERAELITLDRNLNLTTTLSEIENVDLPKTIMELQMQSVGYEAALAASAKAIQPSLMDYLR